MYAWSKIPIASAVLNANITQTPLKANYLVNVRHVKITSLCKLTAQTSPMLSGPMFSSTVMLTLTTSMQDTTLLTHTLVTPSPLETSTSQLTIPPVVQRWPINPDAQWMSHCIHHDQSGCPICVPSFHSPFSHIFTLQAYYHMCNRRAFSIPANLGRDICLSCI